MNNSRLTIPPLSLPSSSTFLISVALTMSSIGDIRRSSSIIVLTMTPSSTMIVSIIPLSSFVNLADSIRITAVVVHQPTLWTASVASSSVDYVWTILNAPVMTLTGVVAGANNTNYTRYVSNSPSLILPPSSLPSGSYLFTVVATDRTQTATSTLISNSSATSIVTINAVATAGTCVITPAVGTSFVTTFTVDCRTWVEPDESDATPMSYSYVLIPITNGTYNATIASIDSTDDYASGILLTLPSSLTTALFVLPTGQFIVRAIIADVRGAKATVDMMVNTMISVQQSSMNATSQIADINTGTSASTLQSMINAQQYAAAMVLIRHTAAAVTSIIVNASSSTLSSSPIIPSIISRLLVALSQSSTQTLSTGRVGVQTSSTAPFAQLLLQATSAISSIIVAANTNGASPLVVYQSSTDVPIVVSLITSIIANRRSSLLRTPTLAPTTIRTTEMNAILSAIASLPTNCPLMTTVESLLTSSMTMQYAHIDIIVPERFGMHCNLCDLIPFAVDL